MTAPKDYTGKKLPRSSKGKTVEDEEFGLGALRTSAFSKTGELINVRWEAFCLLYVTNWNATESYIQAGFKSTTRVNAKVHASALMRNPNIRHRIRSLNQQILSLCGVTAERVKMELARVAFSDPRKLYSADGRIKPIAEMDDDTAAAISQFESAVERTQDGEVPLEVRKVKMAGKVEALKILAQHFKVIGMDEGAADVLVSELATRLAAARERVRARKESK